MQVNINPAYQSDELKHSLTLVGVKCLLAIETFKTQNYPEIIERIDRDIWKRPPNTPVGSRVLPFLETVVFDSKNSIRLAAIRCYYCYTLIEYIFPNRFHSILTGPPEKIEIFDCFWANEYRFAVRC